MKILITGATGLVGSVLTPFLQEKGHDIWTLTRKANPEAQAIHWDIDQQQLDPKAVEGFDAVIHLAGENIAAGRWNDERKRKIKDSRVKGTRLLTETLAKLENPPKVLVCASAVGYYGDRGSEVLTETSPPGEGFLPEVCIAWEEACQPARDKGIRVVNTRFGMVLSGKGGALQKMLPPFQFGIGGILGSGRQYMSWVAIDDLVAVLYHVIQTESLVGPVNTVAPEETNNARFTKALGRVLHRPTIAPVPAFAIRLLFGEMGDDLLLASTRVKPNRLLEAGFRFKYPEIESALAHVLAK